MDRTEKATNNARISHFYEKEEVGAHEARSVGEILTRALFQRQHQRQQLRVEHFRAISLLRAFFPSSVFAFELSKLAFMAQHPDPCEICAHIENIKNGVHAAFIAELSTGYAILGNSQFFRGYTLFLCKTPAPDLEDLPRDLRFQFLREMSLVSEAVSNVINPQKMNVESLGNMVPHLHFHLFPRQASEAEPLKPVWLCAPQGEAAAPFAFDAARDGELLENLRREILKLKSEF